jgi:SAM-dependent methyltransferase
VHRRLADPSAGGRATTTRLHDLLVSELASTVTPRVLDAGCGLGGTMLHLAVRLHGRCTGITLSADQAATANAAARQLGLAGSVSAVVGSYDTPPAGPFDVVVAIESLAHSPAPDISVAALAGVLAPGGMFVIVDDLPDAGAAASSDLATFKAGWRCPVLWGHDDYLRAFDGLALHVVTDRDLTDDTRPRALGTIRILETLNRLACGVLPFPGLRDVLRAHRGGLALERLTRRGLIRYRLLMAQRR